MGTSNFWYSYSFASNWSRSVDCVLSMLGKIMTPMCRLWLHGLYGPWCQSYYTWSSDNHLHYLTIMQLVIIPPAPPKVERGYTGFTLMSVRPSVRLSVRPSVRPSVCPSVCPSVGKVSATFRENCRLDSFHPWDLYLWGKSLDPYRFSCSCPHFWPSGDRKLTENRGFRNFRENCRLDSFHPRDLYLWGKSLDPYRFSCSCPHFWPSGGQKLTENRGFPNFSRKLSARFISSLGFILMG